MELFHYKDNCTGELLKDSILSLNGQSSINSNNSNINLLVTNNKSSISNLSNNNSVFPSLKSCIIFYLSETGLNNYLKQKENFICQEMKKEKEKYSLFYLFLDALNNINNKDFVNYRKKINDIEQKYLEKNNSDDETELTKNNKFIFETLLFDNITILRCKERNLNEYIPIIIENQSEDEVIKKYKEKENDIKINYLYDLFYTKVIRRLSLNHYKIIYKYLFHFIITDIKNTSLEYYFNDYIKNGNDKIYSFPNILIFIFETNNDEVNYNIKYEKEIWLPIYNGQKIGFILNAIIYENNEEYNIMIHTSSDEKRWKIFDNQNIKYNNLSFDLTTPIMLFYKKVENLKEKII